MQITLDTLKTVLKDHFDADKDYVVVRHGDVPDRLTRGYTREGEIPDALGTTMVVMARPPKAVSVSESVSESASAPKAPGAATRSPR